MAKEKLVTEIWDDLVDSFSNIRTGANMPRYLLPNMPCIFGRDLQACDSCCVKLTIFKRKKLCSQCRKVFCNQCIAPSTDKTVQCRICMILFMRPLDKKLLLQLRIKDLQRFLTAHHVSTHGCVEKEDLVELLLHYTSQKSSTGNSSGFSPNVSSSIPDEVGIDASVHLNESTNSAAGANSSISSPTVDSTTREVGTAATDTTEGDCRQSELPTGETAEQSDVSNNPTFTAVDAGTSAAIFTITCQDEIFLPPAGPSCSTDSTEPSSSCHLHEPSTSTDGESPSRAFSASLPGSPHLSQTQSAIESPIFARPSMATIRSQEEMEQMSVKQLKCLLARHRVDYHGCCEKAELVERASRLWKDYKASRVDLDNLDVEELCKVCMDAPIECVMLECGHMATCTDCGRQLCECPICRQYVVRIVRTFRA